MIMTSKTHFPVIEILIAVVDIMIGGAGSFRDQTKEAFLFFKNDLLPFLGLIGGVEVFWRICIDILVSFGVLFDTFDRMACLAGDRFVDLDRILF
jgi:hypothetical protein